MSDLKIPDFNPNARPATEHILRATGITKSFKQGSGELSILRGIDLDVRPGESICIVGSSGAGKSTLLHILGTLDQPTSGELQIAGEDVLQKSDDEMALFRNREMGFVFQSHYLLGEFTALENVMMPCRIAGDTRVAARIKSQGLLEMLGLASRASHFPNELSGGELQRVAIARALVRKPKILFADEPTGNLDSQNSQKIQELFFELKTRLGLTLLVVTHDLNFAKKFDRCLRISDGRIA